MRKLAKQQFLRQDDCEPEQRVPDLIKIKSLAAKAGIVLNPATPLTAIDYVLDGDSGDRDIDVGFNS
ncbi:hypothetical protein ACP70R_026681 [Stipagrostis hirtigluma subsp. patula]